MFFNVPQQKLLIAYTATKVAYSSFLVVLFFKTKTVEGSLFKVPPFYEWTISLFHDEIGERMISEEVLQE